MENVIRTAVEVCDNDYDLVGIPGYVSRIAREQKWKYRKARFFAWTERAKEMIFVGGSVCFGAIVISYFTAHWVLYITGYYAK